LDPLILPAWTLALFPFFLVLPAPKRSTPPPHPSLPFLGLPAASASAAVKVTNNASLATSRQRNALIAQALGHAPSPAMEAVYSDLLRQGTGRPKRHYEVTGTLADAAEVQDPAHAELQRALAAAALAGPAPGAAGSALLPPPPLPPPAPAAAQATGKA
jgi:hypothetical protein